MDVLLDTDALLYALTNDYRLGPEARKILSRKDVRCLFSPVSLWHIALEHELDPDNVPISADEAYSYCIQSGALEAPLTADSAVKCAKNVELPPEVGLGEALDNMLICQAVTLAAQFMTCDEATIGLDYPLIIDGRC